MIQMRRRLSQRACVVCMNIGGYLSVRVQMLGLSAAGQLPRSAFIERVYEYLIRVSVPESLSAKARDISSARGPLRPRLLAHTNSPPPQEVSKKPSAHVLGPNRRDRQVEGFNYCETGSARTFANAMAPPQGMGLPIERSPRNVLADHPWVLLRCLGMSPAL